MLSTFEIKENIKANHLLAQHFAQAVGSRPGEEDPHLGESSLRLSETFARSKRTVVRLGDHSWKDT